MKRNVLFALAFLTFSGIYAQENKKEKDTLKNNELSEVTVIGSRSKNRVKTDVPVPIDIFNISEIAKGSPQTSVTQMLNYVAPSFSSGQVWRGFTNHTDTAKLRGLGPDQVLVLVNGKRRHTNAYVNVSDSPGRGSVGVDFNAIPAFAIERIEVLRDGAAAQYGSDAIAGVINIVLKKNAKYFSGEVQYGMNVTPEANNFKGGIDGQNTQVDLNYGTSLGKKGSFLNITASAVTRGETSRSGIVNKMVFDGYDAIEHEAAKNGVRINDYFGNINSTPNQAQIMSYIKQYAQQIDYFTKDQQSAISNASNIKQMQDVLKTIDATNGEVKNRGKERSDYSMKIGQAGLLQGQLYYNLKYPFTEVTSLYSFGGVSYRNGESNITGRLPSDGTTTFTEVYPDGFSPRGKTKIIDLSGAVGLTSRLFGFDTDISTNLGTNSFKYNLDSSNATLGTKSPTSFYAGRVSILQSTSNLDFTKKYDVLEGLNVAFGGEFRYEKYQIEAGDEASYGLYDINGKIIPDISEIDKSLIVTDFFGKNRVAGSQALPGFRPIEAKVKSRNSGAVYVDLEFSPFKKWLLDGAARYENYSDFGSTVTFKLASLLKITHNLNWRISGQTGFRAPSLQQRYFETKATQNVNGFPAYVGYFPNDSEAAKSIGIENLKAETSKSISTGLTFKIPDINMTIVADVYFTRIDDRIILTGSYSRPSTTDINNATDPKQKDALKTFQHAFDLKNANRASFWTNGINTETKGIDFVISHKYNLIEDFTIRNDFALSYNSTKRVGPLHVPQSIIDAGGEAYKYSFFSEVSRIHLEGDVPKLKANLMTTFSIKKLDIYLRNSYFGKVTEPGATDVNLDGIANVYEHPIYSGKIITDLSLGYVINKYLTITIGVNNIGDVSPDKAKTAVPKFEDKSPKGFTPEPSQDISAANQYVYSRTVTQFGGNGRYCFARLSFRI